jgi:flagellar assembly protein FliH
MSCRRVTGLEAAAAQPVAWRRTGPAPPPADPQSAPQAPRLALPAGRPPNLAEAFDLRIKELTADADARERQARRQGFQEGEAAAAAKATAEIERMTAAAAEAVRDLMTVERQMRRRMEEDLAKLAAMIARRILHREISVDPEALLGIVRAALARLDAREVHRIRIYPREAPMIEKRLAEMHLPQRIEVVADPTLERGAILFETQRGQLDASIETQLEEIDRGLADMLRRRP